MEKLEARNSNDLSQELIERMRKRKCFADKDLEEMTPVQREPKNLLETQLIERKFQENFFNFLIEQQVKQYTTVNPFIFNSTDLDLKSDFNKLKSKDSVFYEPNTKQQSDFIASYSALLACLMNGQMNTLPLPEHNDLLNNKSLNSTELIIKEESKNIDESSAINIKTNLNKITNFSVEALLSI